MSPTNSHGHQTPGTRYPISCILMPNFDIQNGVAVADADGDGDIDVFYAYSNGLKLFQQGNMVKYYHGGGSFAEQWSVSGSFKAVAIFDADMDGDLDVFSVKSDDSAKLYLWQNCPTGARVSEYGCAACPTNGLRNANNDFCLECDENTSPSYGLGSGGTCAQCLPGNHRPLGMATCSVCSPGTATLGNKQACQPCSPGSYAAGEGSLICTPCPAGEYAPDAGSASCSLAPIGHWAGIGTGKPTPCAAGRYGDAPGRTDDQCSGMCERGFYCPAGSTNATVFKCAAGTYEPTGGARSADDCKSCTIGSYCDEGAVAATPCKDVIVGSTTGSTGARDVKECSCGIGFYLEANVTHRRCVTCDPALMDCSVVGSTIANMKVKPGGWRLGNDTAVVHECFNPAACDPANNDVAAEENATTTRRSRRLEGQLPETFGDHLCARGHTGFLCGTCAANWQGYSDEKLCSPCSGSMALSFVPFGLLVLAAVISFVVFIRGGSVAGGIDLHTAFDDGLQAAVQEKAQEKFDEKLEQQASDEAPKPVSKQGKAVSFGIRAIGKVQKFRTKAKILLALWQVLQGLGGVFAIPFPPFYASAVSTIGGLIQIELPSLLPLDCIIRTSYYSRLVFKCVWPLAAYTLLGLLSFVLRKFNKILRADACIDFAFFLVLLLYPSISTGLFSMFNCVELEDGTSWLRVDLSLECSTPTHATMLIFTGVMLMLHTVGSELTAIVQTERTVLSPLALPAI